MRRKTSLSQFSELDDSLINLTPLIDVVFVVLIAFILVAPLLEVNQIALASGGAKSEKIIPRNVAVALHVKEDNSLWLNGKKVTLLELKVLLRDQKIATPMAIPKLFHDKKAFFGTYQLVKNAVEEAGFDQLDVILHGNK